MKRTALLTLALAATLSTAANAQENGVVNVYNWSDYIAEDTLDLFTAETGIAVNYDVFDSNELVEAKLLAGNSGYDVVVPSGFFLSRQIEAGLFQKLDKSKLPNIVNMDPAIMEATAVHDPGNEYGIDYMWGTTGLGYNVQALQERLGEDANLNTWDLMFDVDTVSKLADCGVTMLDAPNEAFAAALNYLGLDPNSESADDLAKAEELLTAIRPYVRYYNSSQYIDDLGNGEVCLSHGYSGDVFISLYAADEAGADFEIGYSIPEEGAVKWFDMFAIPADAPNVDNAHAFIDFMMRADIAANNTNYVYYASGNLAAQDMIEAEVLEDPSIYPTPDVDAKTFVLTARSPDFSELMTRAWTRIKTGQ